MVEVDTAADTPKPKKKSRPISPTQRTLQLLKKRGYRAKVVETWNPHVKIRQDMWKCIDVLAIHPDRGETIAVQATTGDHTAERLAKVASADALPDMLAVGWLVQVWGWRKLANGRWEVREVPVTEYVPLEPDDTADSKPV